MMILTIKVNNLLPTLRKRQSGNFADVLQFPLLKMILPNQRDILSLSLTGLRKKALRRKKGFSLPA